ncbi:MAG: hypothetical protein MHPSP_003568, partial [Paramarteilia canceri]
NLVMKDVLAIKDKVEILEIVTEFFKNLSDDEKIHLHKYVLENKGHKSAKEIGARKTRLEVLEDCFDAMVECYAQSVDDHSALIEIMAAATDVKMSHIMDILRAYVLKLTEIHVRHLEQGPSTIDITTTSTSAVTSDIEEGTTTEDETQTSVETADIKETVEELETENELIHDEEKKIVEDEKNMEQAEEKLEAVENDLKEKCEEEEKELEKTEESTEDLKEKVESEGAYGKLLNSESYGYRGELTML